MADLITVKWIAEQVLGEGFRGVARQLMRSRARVAEEILFDELRRGEKLIEDIGEQDEVAASVFRYARGAQEGAARLNLRLMAQVLTGLMQQRPIYADDFLRWADLIAGLRSEEVILASTLHRQYHAARKQTADGSKALDDASEATKAELVGTNRLFPDHDAYDWNMTALMRTGLVRVWSGLGSISYVPSGLTENLVRLTRIDDALNELRR